MDEHINFQDRFNISVLRDFTRLNEVYRLSHDALAEAGIIMPRSNGLLVTDPKVDRMKETSILLAENNEELIGTISVTLDGPHGLHIERWFGEEVDQIRKNDPGILCTAWRFAIARKFRSDRRLPFELIRKAFNQACQKGCHTGLIVVTYRHIEFYHSFMKAEVVARRKARLYDENVVEIGLLKFNVDKARHKFD